MVMVKRAVSFTLTSILKWDSDDDDDDDDDGNDDNDDDNGDGKKGSVHCWSVSASWKAQA